MGGGIITIEGKGKDGNKKMTKRTMIDTYRRFSAADGYILGYVYAGELWMIEMNEIKPRFLTVEEASRNQAKILD